MKIYHQHRKNWRRRFATLLVMSLAGVACNSGADVGDEPVVSSEQALRAQGGPDSADSRAGGGAAGDEVARTRSALDSRYAQSDVVYTFESYFGETVDCVDYYRHPGIKAQLAEGGVVPDPRARTRDNTMARDALPDFMFNGKPDRQGRSRACPEGSVPMLRVTIDDILAVGGIDAVRSHARQKRPPPDVRPLPPCTGDPETYSHIVKTFNGSAITSGISNMSIHTPAIAANRFQAHSIAQTWTSSGSGFNLCGETCAPDDCYQTVEAGWIVSPNLFFNSNPTSPHLFTYATTDGYATGCYNQDPSRGSTCAPFNPDPQGFMTVGQTLPASTPGAIPIELQISVTHSANGWCLRAGIQPNVVAIGCWPNSTFHGSMTTSASKFQVGGEIVATPIDWNLPMGSGKPPAAGFRQAAYHRNYSANGSTSFSNVRYMDRLSYAMSETEPAGAAWTNWFYYGNEPIIGWVTNSVATVIR